MKGILFLCVANSARSQMAEGIARSLAPRGMKIWSAGSRPTSVRPEAVAVLKEIGIDISHQKSKEIDPLFLNQMDIIVTLCSHAEKTCPITPPEIKHIHWPIKDPVGTVGTETMIIEEFRRTRDEIKDKVLELIEEIKNNSRCRFS